MSKVEESIELEVPVRTAYNQWTQFEEFPRFMEHVDEVRQLDEQHLHWRATVAGKTEEWDAEITEQIPDTRIAWKSTSGRENAGAVDFHPLADERCQIMVALDARARRSDGEGRRRLRYGEPPGTRRPRAVQGDDRVARRREWCLARQRRAPGKLTEPDSEWCDAGVLPGGGRWGRRLPPRVTHHVLERTQVVAASSGDAFAFFADAAQPRRRSRHRGSAFASSRRRTGSIVVRGSAIAFGSAPHLCAG